MHPNDTLNGKLLAHELPGEKHMRRRLGYWRMVEERVCREELIAAGHDPDERGFFILLAAKITENHKDDPPYRLQLSGAIMQQAAFEHDEMVDQERDAAIEALRLIAAGHNDPRALAAATLAKLDAVLAMVPPART